MSRQFIIIGECPTEEEVAQIHEKGYDGKGKAECKAFLNQLRRISPEPEGAELAVRAEPCDAGTYYSVVCYYDNDEAERYALSLEEMIPERWDEQARRELFIR